MQKIGKDLSPEQQDAAELCFDAWKLLPSKDTAMNLT